MCMVCFFGARAMNYVAQCDFSRVATPPPAYRGAAVLLGRRGGTALRHDVIIARTMKSAARLTLSM